MPSELHQDRSALRWIRGDLDHTLRDARAALEDFADGQQERLQECIDQLHHVHGVLEMVQVYGGAMLADEMEKLALALASGRAKKVDSAAEALMLGMVQLPAYLEKIESGGADVPLALLPFMNDLRSAYDAPLVSETSLFAPKLDAVIAAETVRPGSGNRELPQLIRQRRSFYHRGLLNVIRNQNADAGLAQLRDVVDALNTAAGTARLRRLLDAGEALVIIQIEDDEPPSLAVKLLFGKLDRVFKQILDQGEEAAMLDFPIELLKNVLYYVARSHSSNPSVTAVRQAADIANTFPESSATAGSLGSLGGPDREMFDAVSEALAGDLRTVKDQLDLFMRSDRSQLERLTGLAQPIQRIGDTLGMVGRGDLRTRLKRRCDELRDAELSGESLPDDKLMALASDLLFVESSLASLASGAELAVDAEEPMEGAVTQSLSEGEMQRHLRAAVDEAMVDIAKVKDAILQYLENSGRTDLLEDVPPRLHMVAGAMKVLELPEAARLLTELMPYIEQLARGERPAPGIAQRDALADVVIGAECYMQAAVEPGDDRTRILTYADNALVALGLTESAESANVTEQTSHPIEPAVEPEPPAFEPQPDGVVVEESVPDDLPTAQESAPEPEVEETAVSEAPASTPSEPANDAVDSEILEIFGEEADEELEVIQSMYPRWRDDLDDHDSLTRMRRSFHTLKGSGRLVGAVNLGEFSWSIENLLNRVIDGTVEASSDLMQVLDEAIGVLPQLVRESRDFGHPGTDVSALSARAFAIAAGERPAPREAETAAAVTVGSDDGDETGEESDGAGDTVESAVEDVIDDRADDVFEPVSEDLEDENPIDTVAETGIDASSYEPKPLPERLAEAEARLVPQVEDAAETEETLAPASSFAEIDESSGGRSGDEGVTDEVITLTADERPSETIESLPESAESFDEFADIGGGLTLEPLDEVDADRADDPAQGDTTSEDAVSETEIAEAPTSEEPVVDASSQVSSLLAQPPDESILTLEEAEDSTFSELDVGVSSTADSSLNAVFVNEAQGHLSVLADFVARCEGQPAGCAFDEGIRRAMHTLRGSSRTAGMISMAELAGGLEDYTNAMADLDRHTDPHAIDLLQRAHQALRALAATVEDRQAPVPEWEGLRDEVAAEVETLHHHVSELQAEPWLSPASEARPERQAEPQGLDESIDQELLEIFLEEAKELLEALETEMADWEGAGDDLQPVATLQRTLHTMKGGSRLAGIATLGDLSHALESVFQSVSEQRIDGSDRLKGLVRHATDLLAQDVELLIRGRMPQAHAAMVERLEAAAKGQAWDDVTADEVALEPEPALATVDSSTVDLTQEPDIMSESILTEAGSLQADFDEEPSSDSALLTDSQLMTDSELLSDSSFLLAESSTDVSAIHELVSDDSTIVHFPSGDQYIEGEGFVPRRPMPEREVLQTGASERVRVPSEALDHMVNNAGEVSIYRARLEQQNSTFAFNLGELQQTTDRLRSQLRDMELETEAQILSGHEREGERRAADFDPLELDRYSTMHQLSRALSETVEDLANLGRSLVDLSRDTDTLLLQQARVTTDLQDSLLRTRMVKFSSRVPRLERVVRQTSHSVGKQANLDVIGGEEDMDRAILERMMGPLEHLLRNAVSHGIEDANTRLANGKPAQGVITLLLAREGSDVVLTLSDDGAGLDRARIRAKAVERGLVEADAAIDDDDLYQMILQSGFSTAQELSQVSGRGVGMDVVLTEVKQLGGALEIASQPGRGTSFTIRLPFTLAITDSLLVTLGDEIYAVPHSSMDGVVRIPMEELRAVYAGEQDFFRYTDRDYTVRYLGAMLGIQPPHLSESLRWLPMLLVRSGEHRVAIQVDGLLGNRQIVVKSVGAQLSTVRWFTGGTILADGQIALILDVNSLVRMDSAQQPALAVTPAGSTSKGVSVMVVDDSITVRKVTSRLLERHNMQVVTAKDGVDAVTQLQEYHPDIMLLDIEMPRMDGYELARHMRSTPELADIPIIMITSRTGDKHRNRAFELGVKRYLGKPYQEADLLENIYTLLAETAL